MSGGQRDASLDIARGVAMVGVVLGHTLRGLLAADIIVGPCWWATWLDTILHLVNLPVFAFAVGLLIPAGVERRGAAPYLERRLIGLTYLYLLWTLLEGGIEVATSGVKNVPVTWDRVASVWTPLAHLWFLPALALATVVTVMIRPWLGRPARWPLVAVAGLVSVATWGWDLGVVGTQGWALLGFFVVGASVTQARMVAMTGRLAAGVLTAGGILLLGGTALVALAAPTASTLADPARTPTSILLGLLGSTCALGGVIALSRAAARSRRGWGALAEIGRQSLPIYLAHIIFTAGTRVLLARVGVDDVAIHLVVGTIAGVVGPLLLVRVTRRWPWLFRSPWTEVPRPRP